MFISHFSDLHKEQKKMTKNVYFLQLISNSLAQKKLYFQKKPL